MTYLAPASMAPLRGPAVSAPVTVPARIKWTPALRKELRHHVGLTAPRFAQLFGVRETTIRRWESENCNADNSYGPSLENARRYDEIAYRHRFVPQALLCPDPSVHKGAA